jgi:uncharacterized protein
MLLSIKQACIVCFCLSPTCGGFLFAGRRDSVMENYIREMIWSFSQPYYNGKDLMHGIKHIERVLKKADNLASKYPQASNDVVFTACCLHGVVYSNEEIVRTFLRSLNIPREQVEKSIIAAFESQVSSVPESLEGKIVHDAHLIEGGKTFLAVKSLVVGTARGQVLGGNLRLS